MKYKYEQIERKPEKEHKPKKMNQKECIALCKEKEYRTTKPFEKSTLHTRDKDFHRGHEFQWEMFQWTDYEFVNWANSMPETLLMAVMAELKQSPKMKPSIEGLRSKVHEIPFCSIDEYRKKKRLGERSVAFLKKLKEQYGKPLLRILYLTSHSD